MVRFTFTFLPNSLQRVLYCCVYNTFKPPIRQTLEAFPGPTPPPEIEPGQILENTLRSSIALYYFVIGVRYCTIYHIICYRPT